MSIELDNLLLERARIQKLEAGLSDLLESQKATQNAINSLTQSVAICTRELADQTRWIKASLKGGL